jgi:hypothetical protein
MPELETVIRDAAPRSGRAPADLEWRIWSALAGAAPADEPLPTEPELVVDEPPSYRHPGRSRPLMGVLAAAAILLAAVAVAGLREHRDGRPAADGRHTAPVAPKAGRYYVDNTCPDPDRGACFDPFPAGRYSFHKSYPQVTLAVPAGWRNDESWPLGVSLSRPDTPGARLEILNDAHALQGTGCNVDAAPGRHDATFLVTPMMHQAGFGTSGLGPTRIGELRAYRVDLNGFPGAQDLACPRFAGTPLLASPPDASGNDGWVLALRPGESARIAVADGTGGRSVALVATVRGDETALKAWIAKAQPVIDSITFAPCTTYRSFAQPCEDLPASSP